MYPKGSGGNYDKKEEEYIGQTKQIEGTQILFSGNPGSGKSVATYTLAEEFKNHGATIITITEKENSELDGAFTEFLPSKESEGNFHKIHKTLLDKQKEEPQAYPTKIYHPLTFEIPKAQIRKLPDTINFFTIPATSLTSSSLISLFSGDIEKSAVKIIESIVNRMKGNETLFDLLWKIYDKIEKSKDDQLVADEESGYIPTGTTSTKKTRNEILGALSYFIANPLIDVESERNLDIQKMILDNKNYHLLTVKWISNPIIKYFCYIWIIDQIMKNLGMMKKAPVVVIILEEIRVILPNKDKNSSSYQQVLSQLIKKLLSTARKINSTSVTTIGNTQVMFDTDKDYRSTCNLKFIGIPADEDLKVYGKDYNFSADTLRKLKGLRIGEFMLWKEDNPIFISETTRHAMPTSGYNYLNVFEKVHPERIIDQTEFFQKIKELHKGWMNKSKDRKSELELKIEEEKKKEKLARDNAKLNRESEQKAQIESYKKKEQEKELQFREQCYKLKQSGMSVREIAGKIFGQENKEKKKDSVSYAIKKYEDTLVAQPTPPLEPQL